MTDQEFAKEQYERLRRYAEYVWQHVPNSPEKDSIIEEILIGMSEAKRRYNELKDKR
jgi:D-serine dehydratase